MDAPDPLRIAICCESRHRDLADLLVRLLQDQVGRALRIERCELRALPAAPDLLIQLADPLGLPAAIHQLTALHTKHPGFCTLGVLQDLQPVDLRALLRAGANDFVSASAIDDEFLVRVHRLLGWIAPQPGAAAALPDLPDLIGHSPAFAEQVARLPMLARYDVGVLLLGETGTGKEVFAQAAHYLSARSGQPWVAVNCGAIPADLVEDELFGHVRGAYTHAHASRAGLIREAEGGTLFLDEIDALPPGAQVKLLRFLQDKQYRLVGSSTQVQADVRVFAASNRPLADLAAQGTFRSDLLFRLNVITLHLPPLRDRLEDIGPLAQHFLQAAARRWHRPVPTLSRAALNKLLAHRWPGNVRELKNVMERATLLGSGTLLDASAIELDGDREAPVLDGEESFRAAKERLVENFERAYIEQLLAHSGGNVTHAAQAAKKNRRAFFELMRKYRIEPDRFRHEASLR